MPSRSAASSTVSTSRTGLVVSVAVMLLPPANQACASLGAVPFGDGQGQFPFGVVTVADVDDVPVVDDGDVVEVGGRVAGVVGLAGELVEVGAEAPGAAVGADGGEGDRVGAGLGENVAAEAEHVRPPAQVQLVVLREAAELPGGFDHPAVVWGDVEQADGVAVADGPVGALSVGDGAGGFGGVFGDVAGEGG